MSIKLIEKFKDKQALSKLKSRDKEAFVKVYDENVNEINRFVYFKIGKREEANDLTSIIFLKAWNHIQNKTLEDAKTLRSLLYKIARNAVIDYYREHAGRTISSIDDEENKIDVADESQDAHEKIEQEDDINLIKSQLPFLKEEYREIIVMRFVNDLSLEEISDITGKTKGNIRVILHRALNALRELIEEAKKL
jgi:RNA polymerase sigma-70 factor (ECF subfamily)